MQREQLKEKIDNIVNCLIEELKKRLGHRLESITLTGSYVTGKISPDRPDVNLILFFKEWSTPDDLIELGKILYELVEKFKDEFIIRPEFRPFRFVYPRIRDKEKIEVFVNPIILNMAEKEKEFPFNVDPTFLDGAKASRKVVHGSDVLGKMKFELNKEIVIRSSMRLFPLVKIQLDRAPLAYDIEKEPDLLFNEALAQGKLLAYQGVEIAMSNDELGEKKYIEIILDKKKLLQFFRERYDKDVTDALNIILEARKNYLVWKNDKEKAIELYKAACDIWQKIMGKLLIMAGKQNNYD